jgi:acetate kinase
MKILVLNCGSSSIKFQFFSMEQETVLCKGVVERIGTSNAYLNYQAGEQKVKEVQEVLDHNAALAVILNWLTDKKAGVIQDKREISGIGHRVVHGGEKFSASIVLDNDRIAGIEPYSKFAPLHNPHNLRVIKICRDLMPGIPQVAVFDTAFHHTMPPKAYLYGLPYEIYEKLGIRRYGFHGTSHRYVTAKAAELAGRPAEQLKIITCHLGNGSSIAAVDGGRSIDTSMGFTPLEGLVMGTRCGDLDPAIVLFLQDSEKLTTKQMDELMNKKSGVLGLSGISNDMREVMDEAGKGHARAQLALDVFCLRIKKYVGSYLAELGGADIIVFTGGIGENAWKVRAEVCAGLEFAGVIIDPQANREKRTNISTGRTKVMIIPTNEELMIARDTAELLDQG